MRIPRKKLIDSGLLAGIALIGTLYGLEQSIAGLSVLKDLVNFALIIGFLLLLGIILSGLSTHFAVRKYLGMKLDDLY